MVSLIDTASHLRRTLGRSALQVSPIALGCWPIAGMTSTHVNDVDSLATLQAAFDAGINFLDTAFGYGIEGESEKLIAQAIRHRSDSVVIASKAGMAWDGAQQRRFDAAPATVRRQCEMSLRRLGRDWIDLYYLHADDGKTPMSEIAGAFAQLMAEGKIRAAGVSNLTPSQLDAFAAECPITAVQDYFNMLQQTERRGVIDWCQRHHAAFVCYWPLMKGLLAGQLPRDFQFSQQDSRRNYPQFQGRSWELNQDFVEQLRAIAMDAGKTVSQIVIYWTMHQAGITSVLCGAKRAQQIVECASVMNWHLPESTRLAIDQAIGQRLALEESH